MKIPVHNNTAMPIYVGAAMIPPGETRHFDEHDVPHHLRTVEQAKETVSQTNADPLAELLKGTIKDITAKLPGIPTEEIEKLGDLEQLGQARKGLLSAIAETLLERAAQADMLAKVAAFSDEDLAAALEAAKDDINIDDDYLSALEAEASKRNPEAAE